MTRLDYWPESPTSLRLSWMFPESNAWEQLGYYVIEVVDRKTDQCVRGVLLSNTEVRMQQFYVVIYDQVGLRKVHIKLCLLRQIMM